MVSKEGTKGVASEEKDAGLLDGHGAGRAWLAIEEGHLAEALARLVQREHQLVATRILARDARMSLDQDVETISRIALGENQLVAAVAAANDLPGKPLELRLGQAAKEGDCAQGRADLGDRHAHAPGNRYVKPNRVSEPSTAIATTQHDRMHTAPR